MIIDRTPWPVHFPEVIVHSDLKTRDADPDFKAAKRGDDAAAVRLAGRLISRGMMPSRSELHGATLLPVTALEVDGFNAIPDAMAQLLSAVWGMPVESGVVVQANRVAHTRADGWHRLATPATFDGPVDAGGLYLLVDDHVGFGGTLANLRGHIEKRGGHVVGMTTLSETREARRIAIRPETLSVLRNKHGQALEDFWQDHFGYGLDCLTDIEAGFLARELSFDVIRDRMVEAAEQARRRGIQAVEINPGG